MKCWIGDSTVSPAATHCLRGGYCLTLAHGLARFFTNSKLMCSAQIMGTESVAYTQKNKGSCFLF